MKNGYLILLIITLVLVLVSGLIVRTFVSNFSAVYPPIKKYNIQMTQSDFREIINTSKNKNINIDFKLTDSTGNKQIGFFYYVDCQIRNVSTDNLFNFKYYKNETDEFITIDLIGAFDLESKTGGYKKKDIGVQELIELFENQFIEKLEYK